MKNEELEQWIKPKKRRLVKITVLLLLLAVTGFGFMQWQKAKNSQLQDAGYVSEPLRKGELSVSITATGSLEPTNEVTIGSELSGTALEVYVDINDRVKKGQQLAKLDTTKVKQQTEQTRASLRSAKASVAQAKAEVKLAQANDARLKKLHEISGGKSPSRADLDSSEASVAKALADLESAEAKVAETEAQLKTNERDLSIAVLTSPVDGIVLSRAIEPGQTVAASFQAPELFVIAEDLTKMELIVNIAEADIGKIKQGQDATFTVDAWPQRKFEARVTRVSFGSETTDNVVTYSTELEVSNIDMSLRPGMTATVEIKVAEAKDVFLVSNSALRFKPQDSAGEPSPQKGSQSLLEKLTPRPPRGGGRKLSGADAESAGPPSSKDGMSTISVLRDGHPELVEVQTGLSDGRHTEVHGRDLVEDMEIITSQKLPQS